MILFNIFYVVWVGIFELHHFCKALLIPTVTIQCIYSCTARVYLYSQFTAISRFNLPQWSPEKQRKRYFLQIT